MTNTSPENDDEVPTDEIPADSADKTPEPADAPTDESPAARPGSLTAVVAEHKDAVNECTLYPAGAADEALVTEWITAEEDSYVELDSMR